MGRDQIEREIRRSKRAYEAIEIPPELDQRVKRALKAGEAARGGRSPGSWNRSRSALAAAAALILCFTAGLNTSQAFAAAAANLPVIGAVSKVLTFRTYDYGDQDKTIHMEIPRIEQAETAADINQQIERLMDQYRTEAETHIAEYKEAFLATGGTEEEFAQKGIRVDAGYEVKFESEDVLSLVITANENWSNAYGVQYFYNLDLRNGKELTLEGLLGSDYREKADQSIRRQMKERMEADGNLVYWDGTGGMTGYEGVDENTRFYLNSRGVPVVVFEKYEIAPGAFGPQEFEITGGQA